MWKKTLVAVVLGLALTGPALAMHCPMDAKAIDQALPRSTLSDSEKETVQSLRDEGMELHEAGDHHASEAKLAEAMRILLSGGLN